MFTVAVCNPRSENVLLNFGNDGNRAVFRRVSGCTRLIVRSRVFAFCPNLGVGQNGKRNLLKETARAVSLCNAGRRFGGVGRDFPAAERVRALRGSLYYRAVNRRVNLNAALRVRGFLIYADRPNARIREFCNGVSLFIAARADSRGNARRSFGGFARNRPRAVCMTRFWSRNGHFTVCGSVFHDSVFGVRLRLFFVLLPKARIRQHRKRRFFVTSANTDSDCLACFGRGRLSSNRPRTVCVFAFCDFNGHRAVCGLVYFVAFACVSCVLARLHRPNGCVAEFSNRSGFDIAARANSRRRARFGFRRCRCDSPRAVSVRVLGLRVIASDEKNRKHCNDCNYKQYFVSLHCRSPLCYAK